MNKPAPTEHPVLEVIKARWSPRAFADKPVEKDKLRRLFEAARWAASSYNEQPWRFIVATKEDDAAFQKALGCLVEQNRAWAKQAPILVLTATSKVFKKNGKDNRVAQHDLGQAAAHLALQATDLGLVIHQMAGVQLDKVRKAYNVPDDYEPQTAIAIGYEGDTDSLPEDWMREAEKGGRDRKAFDEFIFGDKWGEPSDLLV